MTASLPSLNARKAVTVLPLAWVAMYALYAWLLDDLLVDASAHLKVALFCASAWTWWIAAMRVAPRVRHSSLAARIGIILMFLLVFTVLAGLLRHGLAHDPVWLALLRNPIVFWLPVIMLWMQPPVPKTD
jgi:hypothetical protein